MGNVLQAGVGQAPARQAALFAGLPDTVPCWTLNKVCGSGLKAVICGAEAIALGDAEIVVAGGMESMSNAPHYVSGLRSGVRMGNAELIDGMVFDGLTDVYDQVHMGICAEECASRHGITRAEQDAFALESTRRAVEAQQRRDFHAEIVPVEVVGRKGETSLISDDEGPLTVRPEKIPGLRPAFLTDGTVTAANASSVNDGAAAVVLMSRRASLRRAAAGVRADCRAAAELPASRWSSPTRQPTQSG